MIGPCGERPLKPRTARPDLRESAVHEWGWVVGHTGFHEIVIIDHAAAMLTLLVASDD